jgi:hypothetical protein
VFTLVPTVPRHIDKTAWFPSVPDKGNSEMTSADGVGKSGRPTNELLRRLGPRDFALISPYLDQVEASADRVLFNPGDPVESVHFPCGTSAAAFVVAIDDDREFDAVLIGREGAAGGIVSHGSLPAFSGITVRFPGPFVRLPVARLEAAKGRSRALAGLFARYADCLLAQIIQSAALQRDAFHRATRGKVDHRNGGAHRP